MHQRMHLIHILASRLDMDALEAAWGLAEVVDENMANAARVHAVENGEDLSEYTMIAFGGALPRFMLPACARSWGLIDALCRWEQG